MNTLLATNKISRFDNHWTHTLTFKQKYILVFYSLLSVFVKSKIKKVSLFYIFLYLYFHFVFYLNFSKYFLK
jgi:hypothetical protein